MSILKKFLLLFTVSFSLVIAQENPVTYLNEAIDLLEKNWEKRDTVDWQDIRTRYYEQVQNAKTIEETYPLLRALLRELGDDWNYLVVPGEHYDVPRDQTGFRVMLPDWVLVYVFDESPAANAGMKVGDQIIAVNGKPVTSRDATDAPRVPTGGGAIYDNCEFTPAHYCDVLREIYAPGANLQLKRVGKTTSMIVQARGQVAENLMIPIGKRFGNLGYIELPPLKVDEQTYIDTVHNAIQTIDETPTCGWMIDLRRHAGGLGPFVESLQPLFNDPATAGLPVAILLSPNTASRGEQIVSTIRTLASNSRTFGEETWGNHPTVNAYPLKNGALLAITTRSGSVKPDSEVKNDWRYFQTEDDPVIKAAMEWIIQQETCKNE